MHGSPKVRKAGQLAAGQSPTRPSPAASSPRVKLAVAQYQSASADALQSEVQHVQHALCACQAAYSKALADVNRSTARIQQLEQQVKALQEEDAVLSGKVPLPVNRLCRVRQWLSEKVTALDAEQAALEGKQMALLKAESKLRSQETEASLLEETAGDLNTAAAADEALSTRRAAEKHDREVAAARRQLMLMAAGQQHEQQRAAAEDLAAEQRSRMAVQCQGLARERLSASQAAIKSAAAAAATAVAGQHSRQLESLMQLKAKVDEVRQCTAKNAEKARQLRKLKREQEQREFEALQEQGLNPYEVYRVRDAEAAAVQAAAQQAVRQKQRKAEIAAALAAEDRAHRKQLAKQEFDRQVEQNYQQQMGITAQQQRTDAYMRSHTLAHQAVLNPTSRVPVYPSEAVLVKPMGFGLGRSSPEAVRKVAARHATGSVDLRDCPLLPSKYRSGSSPAGAGASLQQDESDTAHGPDADEPLAANASGSDAGASLQSDEDADSEEARDVDALGSSSGGFAGPGPDSGSGNSSQTHRRGRQKQQLQVAKLSKFEAGRLEQAKQRHKEQIARPKAAFGRVFAGDAFISDPAAVVFKDFVPGQAYKATVQLINRSFTGSSIRLLEVPTEVMHVVELDMPPSGCLAPGASATLKVTFKPVADEPLEASIPLLADSGPLGLPFRALVRQALPSIEPCPVVSLDGRAGGVMLGASGHTAVTISNAGVLSMLYSVKVTGPLAATTEYDEPPGAVPPADASEADLAELQAQAWAAASLSVAGIRVQGMKGRVQGYGSCSFRVEFKPRVPGPVEVPVLVSFSAPDSKGLAIPPIALTLTATGKELPVSTLTPLVDFKCVMFGQSYTAPLLLANAGKSAMKVLVAARPELAEWITFTPDFGFIQASDTLAVSVALKVTPDMTHKLAKYLVPQQLDSFEFPVQVNVPGQPLPLPVKIRLQATTSDIILSPKTLDFGRVPLTEASGLYITISNPSALPQCFSFGAKLPMGLRLSPNSGYGRVLPHQSVKVLATFQPPIPGLQYFDVGCRTLSGRVFKLEGKCEGLQPEVTLSHNVIKFPTTACEDSSSASLIIRNSSSDGSRLFEFGVPQGSFLKVTPRVGLLAPESSMRVQVDFSPPALPPPEQAATAAGAAAAALAGQAGPPASGSASSAAAASSGQAPDADASAPQTMQQGQVCPATTTSSSAGHYREWLLPCYIKAGPSSGSDNTRSSSWGGISLPLAAPLPLQASTSSSVGKSSADSTATVSSSSAEASCVLHVSVTACAISPELHILAPEMPKPPGKNYWVLDFGALPVGERATRELLLENRGADVASLTAAPLDPLIGAFSIVNALRPLEPDGGKGRVLLAFSPTDCSEYQEIITLRSSKGRLRVCLRGQGIAPTLAVTPATATAAAGGLTFGDVLLSDPVCKELKLQVTNTGPFTINYSTRFIGPGPAQAAHADGNTASAGAGAGAAGGKPAGAVVAAATASSAGAPSAPPVKPLGGVAAQGAPAAAAATPAAAQPAPPAATAASPGLPSGCFVCKPSGGVLLAGQSQELTVVFAPLGAPGVSMQGSRGPCGPLSPYVSDRLQITVPHQQQDVVVPLHGNAWPDGLFVAGAVYKQGSSSSSRGGGGGAGSAAASVSDAAGDPFAAIMLAAAAAAAAAATPAAAGVPGSGAQSAKGKKAAAAATAAASVPQQQDKPPSQPLHALQPKDTASALAAAGYCDLTQGYINLPPVGPGQCSTASVEFGAIKSSAGGAAGELLVEELAAETKEAGWSVDPVKVSVPAGEKRPLLIRYTAPAAAKLPGTALGALGQMQLPVQQSVRLSVIMKGGCQAMPGAPAAVAVAADGSRRMSLVCSCVLVPAQAEAPAQPGQGSVAAATPAAAVVASKK